MNIDSLSMAILSLALLVLPASADVLPEGHKAVRHDIFVQGMEDHPDYVFLIYPTHVRESEPPTLVEPEKDLSFYPKGARPHLWAVPKDGELPEQIDGEWLKEHAAARSEIGFEKTTTVEETNAAERIETIYQITAVEDGKVVLTKASHTVWSGGKKYSDVSELDGKAGSAPSPALLIGIAGGALALLVLIVLLRRRK